LSKTEDLSRLYFQMFNEIGIISQLSSNRLERVLPEGMSIAQFSLLNHLVRLGGSWAPSRLARAFQVTKGAMTNTLQRLDAQGLIRVATDPDDLSVPRRTAALERELILAALARTTGNKSAAARLLDISYKALLYKIRDHGIEA
jgi:DNA-binding MarR family transcriptional regulator